jgi:hypothetical protein
VLPAAQGHGRCVNLEVKRLEFEVRREKRPRTG